MRYSGVWAGGARPASCCLPGVKTTSSVAAKLLGWGEQNSRTAATGPPTPATSPVTALDILTSVLSQPLPNGGACAAPSRSWTVNGWGARPPQGSVYRMPFQSPEAAGRSNEIVWLATRRCAFFSDGSASIRATTSAGQPDTVGAPRLTSVAFGGSE